MKFLTDEQRKELFIKEILKLEIKDDLFWQRKEYMDWKDFSMWAEKCNVDLIVNKSSMFFSQTYNIVKEENRDNVKSKDMGLFKEYLSFYLSNYYKGKSFNLRGIGLNIQCLENMYLDNEIRNMFLSEDKYREIFYMNLCKVMKGVGDQDYLKKLKIEIKKMVGVFLYNVNNIWDFKDKKIIKEIVDEVSDNNIPIWLVSNLNMIELEKVLHKSITDKFGRNINLMVKE